MDDETGSQASAQSGRMTERKLVIISTLLTAAVVALGILVTTRVVTDRGTEAPGSPAPVANPVAPGFQPLSVAFSSTEQGLIAGSAPCENCTLQQGGLIASTDDGGQTWTVRYRADRPILGLAAVGGTNIVSATATDCGDPAFVGCLLGPLRSDDGGITWQRGAVLNHLWRSPPPRPVPCLPDHPYAVSSSFPTTKLGWVFCGYTATSASYQYKGLYRTNGGGRGAWRELPEFQPMGERYINPSNMPIAGFAWGISFLRDGHGWMWTLNRYSTLSATANGGMRWRRIWRSSDGAGHTTAMSASLLDESIGYLLTEHQQDGSTLLLTRDGGLTWMPVQRWPAGLAPSRW